MPIYARNLNQAIEKYAYYKNRDPFPSISPALLTSADIQDYVGAAGMVYPFHTQADNFKPASYGINFSGEYLYWDIRDGKKVKVKSQLVEGETFTLKRNSITYIKLEPFFQFPNYIAARFNLQIKHVYRGLLLGTGPLVDPGYVGYLYIPIHNLTDEDYVIKYGEPIIWMEFTKLNPNSYWTNNASAPLKSDGIFHEFKKTSTNLDLEYFLHKAHPNSPIISTMNGLKEDIERVKNETKELNSRTKEINDNAAKAVVQFNRAIIVSIIAICLTVATTIYQTIVIHEKAIDYINIYGQKVSEMKHESVSGDSTIIFLKNQVEGLNKKVRQQQSQIDTLKNE